MKPKIIHATSKKGFTLLEILAASAIITVISYLIITQIVSLQSKISKYKFLPEVNYLLNQAISDAIPIEQNFKKGIVSSYSNEKYNWQIKQEITKIYEDKERIYFIEKYSLTVNSPQSQESFPTQEIYFLKNTDDEKVLQD
jgi:prepilin-type N-terminal cleavage/methylation domain-containing protein